MTGVDGRPEVVIEGSDSIEGPWKEYEFLYKPGNVNNSLPFVGEIFLHIYIKSFLFMLIHYFDLLANIIKNSLNTFFLQHPINLVSIGKCGSLL